MDRGSETKDEHSPTTWSRWLRLIALIVSVALIVILVVQANRSDRPGLEEQGIDRNAPLVGYPKCDAFVPDRTEPPPPGTILPRSALVTRVREKGPTTRVIGYVPLRPVALRRHYEMRADLQVLQIEDEIIEAEALLSDGEFRTYIKATAVCESGSSFIAVVAPELSASEVPTPAGGTPQG